MVFIRSIIFVLLVVVVVQCVGKLYTSAELKAAMENSFASPQLRTGISGVTFEQQRQMERNTKRGASVKAMSPAALKAFYNMSTDPTAGAGKTIALICAYGSPTIESDLNLFSSHFGLPDCTIANGCFKVVNYTGGSVLPGVGPDLNWVLEIALDTQTAHGLAPGAKKLLVLAPTSNTYDLLLAAYYAAKHADIYIPFYLLQFLLLATHYISMSFGSAEAAWTQGSDAYFSSNASVSVFAAAGDNGAAVLWPAVSPSVIAVGGTSANSNSDYTFASETGWYDSGGGCSKYINGSTYQLNFAAGCTNNARALPDVAMNADPTSGNWIYYGYQCSANATVGCLRAVGGSSAATPIFASRAAVNGKVINSQYIYGNNILYRDITSGNNGHPCGVGLDLVTGLGSWVGMVDSSVKASTTSTSTSAKAATTSTAAAATTTAKVSTTTTTAAAATTTSKPSTTTTTTAAATTSKPATTTTTTTTTSVGSATTTSKPSTTTTTAASATTSKPATTTSVASAAATTTAKPSTTTTTSASATSSKASTTSTVAAATSGSTATHTTSTSSAPNPSTSGLPSTSTGSVTPKPTATPTPTSTTASGTTSNSTTTNSTVPPTAPPHHSSSTTFHQVETSSASTLMPQVFIAFCIVIVALL